MSTQVSPSDYEDVEYMLVDPSCSGSGIVGRVDYERVSSRLFLSRYMFNQYNCTP